MAFALALGLGPVAAGMIASVPVLVGAIFQLITPLAVARLGTNRGWVIACTTVQSLSFVPFAVWAIRGHATLAELLFAASVYWSAGMAGVPAWNTWMGTLIPKGMRTAYFANRSRLGQFGVFIGFVLGGLMLALRAAGDAVGWGFQLQSPGFVAAMSLLFLLIGLNFSGLYEFGLRLTRLGGVGSGTAKESSAAGAFAAGALAAAGRAALRAALRRARVGLR
jgi:hypothetical protein